MGAPDKDPHPRATPQTMTAVVARGRSLSLNGRRHGPGTMVELPVDEHAHLLAAGFLLDPRVKEIAPGIGPQFQGAVNGIVRPV